MQISATFTLLCSTLLSFTLLYFIATTLSICDANAAAKVPQSKPELSRAGNGRRAKATGDDGGQVDPVWSIPIAS